MEDHYDVRFLEQETGLIYVSYWPSTNMEQVLNRCFQISEISSSLQTLINNKNLKRLKLSLIILNSSTFIKCLNGEEMLYFKKCNDLNLLVKYL